MPLQKKCIADKNLKMLAWVACLPCVPCGVLFGLCCLRCYKDETLIHGACYPCEDSTLEEYASVISSEVVDSLISFQTSKLITHLGIKSWDYVSDQHLISAVKKEIKALIYNTFNNFNFGNIDSSDLRIGERALIVTELSEAILHAFPDKFSFDNQLQQKNISRVNAKEFHEYFAGAVITLVSTGNFIQNQLGIIGDTLERQRAERAQKDNISPDALKAKFQGANATQAECKGLVSQAGMYKTPYSNPSLANNVIAQNSELPPPPAYGASR